MYFEHYSEVKTIKNIVKNIIFVIKIVLFTFLEPMGAYRLVLYYKKMWCFIFRETDIRSPPTETSVLVSSL
jgi:hypothetical protein